MEFGHYDLSFNKIIEDKIGGWDYNVNLLPSVVDLYIYKHIHTDRYHNDY